MSEKLHHKMTSNKSSGKSSDPNLVDPPTHVREIQWLGFGPVLDPTLCSNIPEAILASARNSFIKAWNLAKSSVGFGGLFLTILLFAFSNQVYPHIQGHPTTSAESCPGTSILFPNTCHHFLLDLLSCASAKKSQLLPTCSVTSTPGLRR